MNIFRRFLLGSKEVEVESSSSSSSSDDNNSVAVPSEVGSSSMHQPDPGGATPQSSQHGKVNDDECVIEILSSDDESVGRDVHDNEGKENSPKPSSITKISDTTGISKPTKDAIRVQALKSTVSDPKPTTSLFESTKSLSVTTSDTLNTYDDEGDEGKENSTAVSRIDNTSNAATSKAAPDAISPSGSSPDVTTKESVLESTELKSVTRTDNSNVFTARKRRRKRSKDSNAVLPTALLSRHPAKRRMISSPVIASRDGIEENQFVFPVETQSSYEHQEMHQERKSATESDLHTSPLKTSDLSNTGKRPRHEYTEGLMTSPNRLQNTQESNPIETAEKAIQENANAQQNMEAQKPSESRELVDSPSKVIPQFKLPPELAPFNNPGVCDYGVIRTSRLRNRKKKANIHQEDILYQNIQGQRRCRATKDGQKMAGQGQSNRCLNCAEGVFKYCHTHRNLDEEQRAFWEQRKRRDSKIGSSSSSLKTNTTTKGRCQSTTTSKTLLESQMKGTKGADSWVDDDSSRFEQNDVRRCVFMVRGKGRCSRKILAHQAGFCFGHASIAKPLMKSIKKDEIFLGQPGTMRCIAVSKVGSKCKSKALDNCVFCFKHIGSPTEKTSPVEFVAEKISKNAVHDFESIGDPTKVSSRRMGQSKGLTVSSNMASTADVQSSKRRELKKAPLHTVGRSKHSRTYLHKSTSDSSIAESDEVPKNIEFPRNIEISKKAELATSGDNICFNKYKTHCWNKMAEGSVLCYKCLQCHEEGNTFDHILNNDAPGEESILFTFQCMRTEKGKRCQNMALKGNVVCTECLKATLGYPVHSGAPEQEILSEAMDSEDSSSTESLSSDSDDSQDSRVSDDTNYDAYCMAYSHKEFFKIWKDWETKNETMDEVEDSRLIKRANNTMSPTDTDGQVKAQYGRVLPHAMKKMIKILELRREDVFLDIGHGVGNTCLHASFCTGCDSRGIEVVSDRHEIALKFRGGLLVQHNLRDPPRPQVGNVDLRLGRLEDPNQKEFLTKGVTRAYVNNFNGVFAERSSKNKDKWFLDDYISGIFASMAPGAIMVTFHPLNLGLDREGSNSLRSKHNLAESDHASYYDSEKILLGQAFCSVKWNKRSGNTNKIYVYKYRRLHQPGHHDAVFLCSNPSCKMATDMIPIPATTLNEDGRCVINHCKCKFSPKNLRKRSSKQTSP